MMLNINKNMVSVSVLFTFTFLPRLLKICSQYNIHVVMFDLVSEMLETTLKVIGVDIGWIEKKTWGKN